MAETRMRKWKIGVGLLVLVSVGLLVYVIIQGVSSKQDRATYKQATAIADKLNSYIDNQQTIPASLSEAGIKNVPSTVSYTRKSDSEYQFCVTYKASNTDVTSQVQTDITNATTDQGLNNSSDYSSYGDSSYTPSDLYLDSTHKAGRQCQTVQPAITVNDQSGNYYDSNDSSGSGSGIDYYNFGGSSSSDSGSTDSGNSNPSSSSSSTSSLYQQ